ncbi:MAG: M20/M25/M40 family metallo-hydrolase, partial [Bacteroidales bacterium]|nr:M20/M25/M40 family metallo-hydrolase [Bacteroidales bacterium]
VLFVSGLEFDKEDKLVSLYFERSSFNAGLPVINITRDVANKLLEQKGKKIEDLEKEINNNLKPASFEISTLLTTSTEVFQEKVTTQNVVGLLEGNDPNLKNEFIIIGGHYDHLGMGGPGSGSRKPDTIAVHYGADDNASGIAGIIEIAEKLAANRKELKRSVIVIAFGAEEMGLLGSKNFTNNPLVDLNQVKAMFNFDMLGRLNPDSKVLIIGGTGTSKESESILNKSAEKSIITLKFSPEGYGPSDHTSFYAEDIPVFFISTGAHQDYHTPEDNIDKIDFNGAKTVADFSYELIADVINRKNSLTFQQAGPKRKLRHAGKLKVALGIMPDFTHTENDGLCVAAVSEGGPAQSGGMIKGDIITALDGKSVNNIYDYMNRLKKIKPGQTVIVDILRDGEKIVLLIQL